MLWGDLDLELGKGEDRSLEHTFELCAPIGGDVVDPTRDGRLGHARDRNDAWAVGVFVDQHELGFFELE